MERVRPSWGGRRCLNWLFLMMAGIRGKLVASRCARSSMCAAPCSNAVMSSSMVSTMDTTGPSASCSRRPGAPPRAAPSNSAPPPTAAAAPNACTQLRTIGGAGCDTPCGRSEQAGSALRAAAARRGRRACGAVA